MRLASGFHSTTGAVGLMVSYSVAPAFYGMAGGGMTVSGASAGESTSVSASGPSGGEAMHW